MEETKNESKFQYKHVEPELEKRIENNLNVCRSLGDENQLLMGALYVEQNGFKGFCDENCIAVFEIFKSPVTEIYNPPSESDSEEDRKDKKDVNEALRISAQIAHKEFKDYMQKVYPLFITLLDKDEKHIIESNVPWFDTSDPIRNLTMLYTVLPFDTMSKIINMIKDENIIETVTKGYMEERKFLDYNNKTIILPDECYIDRILFKENLDD